MKILKEKEAYNELKQQKQIELLIIMRILKEKTEIK